MFPWRCDVPSVPLATCRFSDRDLARSKQRRRSPKRRLDGGLCLASEMCWPLHNGTFFERSAPWDLQAWLLKWLQHFDLGSKVHKPNFFFGFDLNLFEENSVNRKGKIHLRKLWGVSIEFRVISSADCNSPSSGWRPVFPAIAAKLTVGSSSSHPQQISRFRGLQLCESLGKSASTAEKINRCVESQRN